MRAGQARADAELRGADIWGGAINNAVSLLNGGLMQSAQMGREKNVQDAVKLATSSEYPSATKPVAGSAADVPDPGRNHMEAILGRLDPADRDLAVKGIQDIQSYAMKVKEHNLALEDLQGKLKDAETKRQMTAKDFGASLGKQMSSWLPKPDGGLSAALVAFGIAKENGTQGIEEFEPILQGLAQETEAAKASGDPAALAAAAEKNRATIGPLAQKLQMGGSPEWQEKNQVKGVALREGGSLVDPVSGEVIVKGTPKEPKKYEVTVAGPDGRPVKRLATEAEMAAGVPRYVAPKEGSKKKFWVMRDGKPLRISESEYRLGDQPANTREQGRPVTSGDAGRIADLDTSLDDLNKLTESIGGSKATGTAAKVGSMVPNFVTELTGWGTDAKQKQATIDRVKQVIGKALEGGVLRKEDEIKYEKILPTIYDPPDVAASKLNGLWTAIQQRRQTTLDSLADAGYDITKYSARAPRERVAPANGAKYSVTGPDGKLYTFKTAAQLDGFKKAAGIR